MHTDADFLGLRPAGGEGRSQFTVTDRLARFDGWLYGGAAIAVSIAATEELTDRPALWVTTQFVSSVEVGAEVDVHTEVLAAGHRTQQVRVTATNPEAGVVFASLGANAEHRTDGMSGTFERCPEVSRPDDADRWRSPFAGLAKAVGLDDFPEPPPTAGFGLAVEMREPELISHPDPGPGRVCIWARRRDQVPVTPALAAYLADFMPMGIAHALGVLARGISLDNTIRLGSFVETEWMLLDIRPHLVAGGYGHGVVHLWSEDGRLLATASQTASMGIFDLSMARPADGTTKS